MKKMCGLLQLFFYFLGAFLLIVGIFFENSREVFVVRKAEKTVASLFQDSNQTIPRQNLSLEQINQAEQTISKVSRQGMRDSLLQRVDSIAGYREFLEKIEKFYKDGSLKTNTTRVQLQKLQMEYQSLEASLQTALRSTMKKLMNDYETYGEIKSQINALFSDGSRTKVNPGVTRKEYRDVEILLSKAENKNLREKEEEYLSVVRRYIGVEEERKQKEREELINRSYIKIEGIPYINQNEKAVYNGCEVASLLMASQYKGYLSNVTLKDIALAVPKHENDPHQGFIRSIFDFQPKEYSHWIAPDALSSFGRTYTSNQGIQDITGSSFELLKEELQKGNPLIVWVTDRFRPLEEKKPGEEVPHNLHVMLLIGYNTITGDYVVQDPGGLNPITNQYVVEKAKFEDIFTKIGNMAVVVR